MGLLERPLLRVVSSLPICGTDPESPRNHHPPTYLIRTNTQFPTGPPFLCYTEALIRKADLGVVLCVV